MKKIKLIGKLMLIGLFVTTFTPSCTNLDEELFDVVTPEDFLQGEEQYIAYLGQAYTKLYGYASGGYFDMSESTSDEMVVPTRGTDWSDGGIHRRRQMHSYNFEDNNGLWGFAYGGISDCNRLIESYAVLVEDGSVPEEEANKFIAELSGLRAFFYYLLVDTYANVPIVTEFSKAENTPPNATRKEVYDFIMAELAQWSPDLTKDVGGTAYGRFNYWAAKALELKMLMNSEVYTGTANWPAAIAVADEIINSGKFSLESNFFTNFNVNSEISKEFIFAIPYDRIFATGFQIVMQTLHYGNQNTYDLTEQPWNGFCSIEEFYNSFDEKDLRRGDVGTLEGPAVNRGTFIAGYQYKSDGTLVVDSGAEPEDPDGPPVNLTPYMASIGPSTLRQEGARIGKWEFEMGQNSQMNNDYGVFRYAEVLLYKAEAIWRNTMNPTDGIALALVNQVRITHGGTEIGELTTLDGPISFKLEEGSQPGGELLNERGREMAFENSRRQDLLRWGLWDEVEKWSPPSNVLGDEFTTDPYTEIFPIPREQLEANRNLVQNPGYSSVAGN